MWRMLFFKKGAKKTDLFVLDWNYDWKWNEIIYLMLKIIL